MKKYPNYNLKPRYKISKAGLKHFKIPKSKWLKILHKRLNEM